MSGSVRPVNYTPKQDVGRTASQVTDRLGRHGADAVMTEYSAGEPSAITFKIDTGLHGEVMLPHMITDTGDTVWQRFVGSGLRELEAGS